MKTIPSSLIVLLLAVASASPAFCAAEPANAAEARLREALRNTTLQLRAVENERATLQAAQAESLLKEKALSDKVDALVKQMAADKDSSAKTVAGLNTQLEGKETEIGQLKESLAKWKEALEKWKVGYEQASALAASKEAERARLAGNVVLLERRVTEDETKNVELFKVAGEILKRYEKFGLGDALAAREPFIGTTRVKLENLVQEYQDKLLAQKIPPR